MNDNVKTIESLNIADLQVWPVWQYVNDDMRSETAVRPVKDMPAKNLVGCVVGAEVKLANGDDVWAIMGNIDVKDSWLTQHFLTLTIILDEKRFTLARYHDFDFAERGPRSLAAFLKMDVSDVFPISYDIKEFALGDFSSLVGTIEEIPKERLTRSEIIKLAII